VGRGEGKIFSLREKGCCLVRKGRGAISKKISIQERNMYSRGGRRFGRLRAQKKNISQARQKRKEAGLRVRGKDRRIKEKKKGYLQEKKKVG